MNLGETIRQCRRLKGLSQADLCKLSDISESHLSLIEKDKRVPSVSSVQAIADALDIPLSVLFFLAASEDDIAELGNSHIIKISNSIKGLMKDAS